MRIEENNVDIKKRIYEIIEKAEEGDKLSSVYDITIIVSVIVSLLPLVFKTETPFLSFCDKAALVVFIVDYLLRLLTAGYKFDDHSFKSYLKYPFTFMALVDLLSILPSLTVLNNSFKVLRLLRLFRALRVFRVLKFMRYSRSMSIIIGVLKNSRDALYAVVTLAIGYILVSALIMFNVEPDLFETFFDAIYWATVSLTTIGYGDYTPVTTIGRAVMMVSSIVGIAVVALPSGIITAGYMKEINENKEGDSKRERYNKFDIS